MGFFDDDDFFGGGIEELFSRLARDGVVEYSEDANGRKKVLRKGKRNVLGKILLNKVITEKRAYYTFDLTGRENISAKLKKLQNNEKILEVKENEEVLFEFQLDESDTNDFQSLFNNGILEVSYKQ